MGRSAKPSPERMANSCNFIAVRWKRAIPWFLLVCEFAALVYLFGMLMLAGISAGFTWWPIPAMLAMGLLFAAGCVFFARNLGPVQRWSLWTLSVVPAAYLSFFIVKDSWQMAHPVTQTWVIPAGYHGPVYVARSVPQGDIATQGRDNMVFMLDDSGIAAVKEPPDAGWVHAVYEYRASNGTITHIPEAAQGSIDDTPVNRKDTTRRIYFAGAGTYADASGCSYRVNEAYVESPSEALAERSSLQQVGAEQADFIEQLKRRYPGGCSVTK